MTLLQNVDVLTGPDAGRRDMLLAGQRIEKIRPAGEGAGLCRADEVIDCAGQCAFPGLIDAHVHIIGGGGEEGAASRVPEIDFGGIVTAGVTTLVGLLGADAVTRSLECLYAKAKALEAQGITTYLYAGSYSLPAVTFTGSLMRDLVLIDKVIGAGEIAISDHRSSQPDTRQLLQLASEVHLGGMLGGKAGVVHLHVGDGREGLGPLLALEEQSDLPKDEFVPTHVNRSPALFRQAVEYCRAGGHIDLTAGETAGIPVPRAVRSLMESGTDLSLVTVSSDANGSIPGGGAGKIGALYDDLRRGIVDEHLPAAAVLGLATVNAARLLKLVPRKGVIREGADADIVVADRSFHVQTVFAMGRRVAAGGRALPAGRQTEEN